MIGGMINCGKEAHLSFDLLAGTARHIQNFRVVKNCLGDISLQSQPFLRALVAWASILRIIDAYI